MPALAQVQNAVDPEVRQQIEAAFMKYHEAYNQYDAAAVAAFYTLDAIEVLGETGVAVGKQAIEGSVCSHVRIAASQAVT
jgi:ketosteroid isomerase-like protein